MLFVVGPEVVRNLRCGPTFQKSGRILPGTCSGQSLYSTHSYVYTCGEMYFIAMFISGIFVFKYVINVVLNILTLTFALTCNDILQAYCYILCIHEIKHHTR